MSVAALVILLTVVRAEATRKVVVGPKTTLDGLARKYGVPKPEIARANGIHPEAILRNGQTLVIPDPPPSVKLPRTQDLVATVKGDRVAVRRGPGQQFYRMVLLDNGVPVRITARKDAWYQITAAGVPNGWIRSDFVTVRGSAAPRKSADLRSASPRQAPRPTPRPAAAPAVKPRDMFISGERVSLRNGPSRTAQRLALMQLGQRVKVMVRRGDWCRVILPDGSTGWILSQYVAASGIKNGAQRQTSASPPGPRVIRGDRVSIRKGASRSAERVALLDDGTPVRLLSRQGGWCKVQLPSGRRGWVLAQFLGMRSRAGVEARAFAATRPTSSEGRRRASSTLRSRARHVASARPHRQSQAWSSLPRPSADVVRTAFAYRGARYRYGGSARSGFDCSGFTRYVYGRKGVELPHRAAEQFYRGVPVQKSQLKPGDLVFFQTTRRGISHVGIYAGGGRFIHASSAKGQVRVDSLQSGYYAERFRGARRVRQRP